jgi:hypothetical protein
MSAFMCSDLHISTLVNAARHYGGNLPRGYEDPADLFALLVEENVKSLDARYGDGAETRGVQHRFVATPKIPALHVMKLAQSYSYQSCEHSGWNDSIAKGWIEALIASLIFEIPGYDQGRWSI